MGPEQEEADTVRIRNSSPARCAAALMAAVVCLSAAPVAASPIDVHLDVPYRVVDGVILTLDVYVPAGARGLPAVLVVHGGAWKDGDKVEWVEEGEALAAEGFVAYVVNYRLAPPGGTWHAIAPVQDLRTAVKWVRANALLYGTDRTKVGVLGGSAGGNLAMMAGTTGSAGRGRADAVVSWSGSTQLRLAETEGTQSNRANYVGCDLVTCPAEWDYASPYFHVDGGAAPTYVANSTDEIVPVEEAISMAAVLDVFGVPNQLRILEGTRHARAYEDDVWEESMAFLHLHLDGGQR